MNYPKNRKTKPLAERFWSKVDKSAHHGGCWIWTGSLNKHGYGQFNNRPICTLANRQSWILAHGNIPDSTEVCHRCDNPPCVNPDHLFLGTHSVNMADMGRKGRAATTKYPEIARGMNNGLSKLTDEAVRYIRSEVKSSSISALARKFCVDRKCVRLVRDGMTWRHVT